MPLIDRIRSFMASPQGRRLTEQGVATRRTRAGSSRPAGSWPGSAAPLTHPVPLDAISP